MTENKDSIVPKKGDIVFSEVGGDLVEMELLDDNSLGILSYELHPRVKECKHDNGTFPEQFLSSEIIFHRCNECGKIMFHTTRIEECEA